MIQPGLIDHTNIVMAKSRLRITNRPLNSYSEIADRKNRLIVWNPFLFEELSGPLEAVYQGENTDYLASHLPHFSDGFAGGAACRDHSVEDDDTPAGLQIALNNLLRSMVFGLIADPESFHFSAMPMI